MGLAGQQQRYSEQAQTIAHIIDETARLLGVFRCFAYAAEAVEHHELRMCRPHHSDDLVGSGSKPLPQKLLHAKDIQRLAQ